MAFTLTRAGRCVLLAASTLGGVLSGIMADPNQHTFPELGDVVGVVILSPILTLMGPMVTPRGWEIPMLLFGLGFWPGYFWLSLSWVQRATPWAWLAAGVLTFLGFYGALTRLAGVMSA